MHELSIAQNIVEIVEEEVEKVNGKFVDKLILEVGKMSGIVREALEFALDEAVKNSVLSSSEIEIIDIPGFAECDNCKKVFETVEIYSPCPKCSHLYSTIVKGKDLKIKSISIVD